MIFSLLRRRNPSSDTIRALYGVIVAQARLPSFYAHYGVPDTVDGRFDMIVLHLFLLGNRAGREGGALEGLVRDVTEVFCQDLDHNMREMGVGDLAVPRRMRAYVEAFYGRAEAYRAALGARDPDVLARALARNVFSVPETTGGARRLASYMLQAAHALEAQPAGALKQGLLSFPDPETILTVCDD